MTIFHPIRAFLAALSLVTACDHAVSGSHTSGPDDGGTLSILAIPPAGTLDWSTPNTMIRSSALSKVQGELDVQLGRVATAHPIGHLMVRLSCADVEIPLTGQTGGGSEFMSAFDGLGASFRTFPGFLDDAVKAAPDISLRRQNGFIATMNFHVTTAMCHHLAGFLAEYRAHGADQRYGGQFRPRRYEGGGCTSFALAFLEVGGILKRSQYTPVFARELQIGLGRIADYQGAGAYAYGSNLVSHNEQGGLLAWPKGSALRVQTAAISPQSAWLAAWSDGDDAKANVAPQEQPDLVPWTIYDPQLVWDFVQATAAAGGGAALGRTWSVAQDLGSVAISTDATDAVAQPYEDGQDDLRLD